MYITVIETISSFFILIFLALLAKQLRLLNGNISGALSQLVMNFTLPLLLITAFNFELNPELLRQSLLVAIIALVVLVSTAFFLRKTSKYFSKTKEDDNILQFLCLFGNTVFIGYPIVFAVFHEEGLFLGVIFNLVNVIFLWTYGLWLMRSGEAKGVDLRFLREPSIIAMVISILMVIFGLRVPSPFLEAFQTIGSLTLPLSFIIIGLTLELNKIKIAEMKKFIGITFIRLLLIPVLLLIIFKLINVSLLVAGVIVIMLGTPAGVMATIMAEAYKGNVKAASEGIVFSTLVSIATIPFLLFLILKF